MRFFFACFVFVLAVGPLAAQDVQDSITEFESYARDQYRRLQSFHEQNRTKTYTEQRTRTVQVPVEIQSLRTVQVPVTRRVYRWERRGLRMVCVGRLVTVMETRQETVSTTVLQAKEETYDVQLQQTTGLALTSDSDRTLRIVRRIDLLALPAAAGPEINKINAEAKTAAAIPLSNEQILNNEVNLETGWIQAGNYQYQLTIIAGPRTATNKNEVSLQVVAQNAIAGNIPPTPSDQRPVTRDVKNVAWKIADDIENSFLVQKP